MSAFDFRPLPLPPTLDALRAFDRTLARWVLAQGGSPALAERAAFAAFAEGEGHACLAADADGAPPLDAASAAALRADPRVGDGGTHTPFVLDADGRFYLWRNFRHEQVAAAAIARRRAAARPVAAEALVADLDVLFGGAGATPDPQQRAAVAAAVGRRWFVLTGGPGTGKTHTVLRLLLMLARRAQAPLSMQVAAPTGKAAQRIAHSLREGKAALAASLPPDWTPLLAQLPDAQAGTVHRLLGYSPAQARWRHHVANRLPHDVVVVDEASMLDLSMLRALLDAVREDALLVLVGDAGQLSSVGPGSVLADVVQALDSDPRGDLVRLVRGFRAGGALGAVNAAAASGDPLAFADALQAAGSTAEMLPIATPVALRAALEDWADALALHLPREAADPNAAAAALATLPQRQLLCALREGPWGALAADHAIAARLRRRFGEPTGGGGFAGRVVMVTRNDPARGLFNGDLGIELAAPDGRTQVWFAARGEDGTPGARAIPVAALPPHEGGFALTVHKSQGSEYAAVALLLPPDPAHPILERSLLYTGVSRARANLALWAAPGVVAAALARVRRRDGGLCARLADARREA